jgi:hypothetical protein
MEMLLAGDEAVVAVADDDSAVGESRAGVPAWALDLEQPPTSARSKMTPVAGDVSR